jgi:hypothetical protein
LQSFTSADLLSASILDSNSLAVGNEVRAIPAKETAAILNPAGVVQDVDAGELLMFR